MYFEVCQRWDSEVSSLRQRLRKGGGISLTNYSIIVLLKIWMAILFSIMCRVRDFEVKETFKVMKLRKVVGPKGISIEI